MGKDRFKYCCIIVTWASRGIFEALDRPSPIAEAKLMGRLCNLVDLREGMKLVLRFPRRPLQQDCKAGVQVSLLRIALAHATVGGSEV